MTKDDIIIVRRFPPTKTLHANLLGLTLGLTAVYLAVILNYPIHFWSSPRELTSDFFLLILPFSVGTYYFGLFFVIFVSVLFFTTLLPLSRHVGDLYTVSAQYLYYFLWGWILSTVYNILVYLHQLIFNRNKIKTVFAYDANEPLNIIKSPIETEEAALLEVMKPFMYYVRNIMHGIGPDENAEVIVEQITQTHNCMEDDDKDILMKLLESEGIRPPDADFDEAMRNLRDLLTSNSSTAQAFRDSLESKLRRVELLVERYLKLKERKLYNYKLEEAPAHPYTIVIVANPKLAISKMNPTGFDLIANWHDLFLHSVHKTLRSLEQSEVLGRPEIWSRVRVLTIFDEDAERLVEEFPEATFGGMVANNIISPRSNMASTVEGMFTDHNCPFDFMEVDVIFALTASFTDIRHLAFYSDWNEDNQQIITPQGSDSFQHNPDPRDKKGAELANPCRLTGHDHFPGRPGRVALNVLSAQRHTFIHEFAHAMSSAANGAICDEYFDVSEVSSSGTAVATTNPGPLCYVNRLERSRIQGRMVPVHHLFAEYNDTEFYSDPDHPSAEEDWLGYFPERHDPNVVCTMDRTENRYRFDKLLARFMYDRLVAKINRQ